MSPFIAEIPETNYTIKLKNARAKDPELLVVTVGENQLVFVPFSKLAPKRLERFLDAQSMALELSEDDVDSGERTEEEASREATEQVKKMTKVFDKMFSSVSAGNPSQRDAQVDWILEELDFNKMQELLSIITPADAEKK